MISSAHIKAAADRNFAYVVEKRRYLHRHPEKAMHEFGTSAFVKAELDSMGIPWEAVGETGVIGYLRGNGTSGKTVALRADMDALEVEEKSGVEFASETPGMMHACGHDAHTAMLLGAAKVFTELGCENIPGDVLLIFQPAEELALGAKLMVDSGKLNHVDMFYGQHLFTNYPLGKVYMKSGAVLSGIESFKITLTGVGGHGSEPELCKNPMMAAASIISALYTIPVNSVSGQERFVLSVNKAEIGTRMNIIPETGVLEGNIRFFSEEAGSIAHDRIREIVSGIASAYGLGWEVETAFHLPPLETSDSAYPFLKSAVTETLGSDSIVTQPDLMGSEDYSFYLSIAPGTFAFLGTNDPALDCVYPQHSPYYKINEQVLRTGMELHVRFALNFLEGV